MAQESEPDVITIARGWRRWLRLDSDGITIRNVLGTCRISWNEVRWISGSCSGGKVPGWMLAIVLHDGRTIEVIGYSKSRAAPPETLAGIRQAAGRHAVPVVLTSGPVAEGEPDAAGLYPDPGGEPGLRQWTGTEWSPFLEVDPASSGPEGEKGSARVWSPLPGPEQQRQWDAAASRVREARRILAIPLLMTAGAVAWILAVLAYDLSTPKADFGLFWVLLLSFLSLCLASIWASWKDYQAKRRIDEAAKAAAALAGSVDSPPADHDDDPAARAPIAGQPPAAADPAAGTVPVRCLECGTGSTEATQFCARCGAPVSIPIRPEW